MTRKQMERCAALMAERDRARADLTEALDILRPFCDYKMPFTPGNLERAVAFLEKHDSPIQSRELHRESASSAQGDQDA